MVRCKFTYVSVAKRQHWNRGIGKTAFLYEAEFSAVTHGSAENEEFFEATPNGSLKVWTDKENVFEPGKDYYIDIGEVT